MQSPAVGEQPLERDLVCYIAKKIKSYIWMFAMNLLTAAAQL